MSCSERGALPQIARSSLESVRRGQGQAGAGSARVSFPESSALGFLLLFNWGIVAL